MLAALALLSKPLVQLLPRELRPYPLGVMLPLLFSGLSGALGLWFSWIGYRRLPDSSFARGGLIANGTIVGITVLSGLVLLWIFRRSIF
jgi:hypothetical protein